MLSAFMSPPDIDGRVDLETAERLVAEAVVRATAGDDKTAAIVKARVDIAHRRASRHNLLLGLGVALAFVAFAATGLLIWDSQQRAGVLTDEAGLGRPAARDLKRGEPLDWEMVG